MKPTDNINKFFNNAGINTNPKMDEAVLDKVITAHKKAKSALAEPAIRRTIMKSPITKLAAAAVIIIAVTLGLFELIGTDSTSGIAWAEVAKNVEASSSVIWRSRGTGSRDSNDDWPNGYTIYWRSAAVSRMDKYRGGQIYRTIYLDYDTKTVIGVLHDAQKYSKEAMNDQTANGERGWSDPQGLLNLALSLEHQALGQKTINGVLCEGIEAKGPDGGTGRIWVAVETGYPVLVEIESIDAENVRHTGTMDQFEWNVDLSAENVEPEIPTDYESLGLDGEMKTLSEQGKRELIKIKETIVGTYRLKMHEYRYQLSDGQIKDMGEPGNDMPVYTQEQWKEFSPQLEEFRRLREAGPGEDLGTYEETVEGRVFSFKREKYILSDGTEAIFSVGTPKDGR